MSQYAIKPGYRARTEPAYFQDTQPDGKVWQPHSYPIAAYLARVMHRHTLIDIGCGRAHKLMGYAPEFKIVGVDFGDNIQYCKDHYPGEWWIEVDFERSLISFDDHIFKNAVIICADVIEHLANPSPILSGLRYFAGFAPILFTTPDRLRMYGYDHDGEPTNPCHTREWRLEEMTTLLTAHNIPVTWAGYTASEDATFAKNTMLLLLGLDAPYAQSIEQAFDVEAAR